MLISGWMVRKSWYDTQWNIQEGILQFAATKINLEDITLSEIS
jgi:hypothetical protein